MSTPREVSERNTLAKNVAGHGFRGGVVCDDAVNSAVLAAGAATGRHGRPVPCPVPSTGNAFSTRSTSSMSYRLQEKSVLSGTCYRNVPSVCTSGKHTLLMSRPTLGLLPTEVDMAASWYNPR